MTQTQRPEALPHRTAELRDLNARLHAGEQPSADVLRRAWTLAAPRAGLPPLAEAELAAQLGRTVNAWAGRETVRLLGFMLQAGEVRGWITAQPWAEERQCVALAEHLTRGTRPEDGRRTVLLCLHVWDGKEERPARGQDPEVFAFTQASDAWSGFTLI